MAQIGAGGGSEYPTFIDTAQTYQNGANAMPDGPTRIDAEFANDVLAALLQLQEALGAQPGGSYASVRARLDAIFDQAVSQITVDPTSGRATGKTTTTVNTSTGTGTVVLTATAAIPAGVVLLGVTGQVTVTCGNSNGLTTWSLGTVANPDRWGSGISRTAPAPASKSTNAGMWKDYTPTPMSAAMDVIITADAGTWDATGQVKITSHWETFAADD